MFTTVAMFLRFRVHIICNVYNVSTLLLIMFTTVAMFIMFLFCFSSATPHSWIPYPPINWMDIGCWVHSARKSIRITFLSSPSGKPVVLMNFFPKYFGPTNPGTAIYLEYARLVPWMPNASEGRPRCEFLQFHPVLSTHKSFSYKKELARSEYKLDLLTLAGCWIVRKANDERRRKNSFGGIF